VEVERQVQDVDPIQTHPLIVPYYLNEICKSVHRGHGRRDLANVVKNSGSIDGILDRFLG